MKESDTSALNTKPKNLQQMRDLKRIKKQQELPSGVPARGRSTEISDDYQRVFSMVSSDPYVQSCTIDKHEPFWAT